MKFAETKLKGAFVIEPEKHEDARGFFARTWCKKEFALHGIPTDLEQCNVAYNTKAGTMRGMHFQAHPFWETKLVRCTSGALYDVIIDLRPESPTFKQWIGAELTAKNHRMLFVPVGFGHGYLTLADETEACYQMGEFFVAGTGRGMRWNDPAFGIKWPGEVKIIHERDNTYPDFTPALLEPMPAEKVAQ